MPNIRFTLWIVLGAVLYYNYLAWQQDYRALPQLTSAAAAGAGARGSLGNSVPTPEGGTHEAGLRAALTRSIKAYGELTNNKRAQQIAPEDVMDGAVVWEPCSRM